MRTKTFPARIKAPQDGTAQGQFEAVVATYDLDSTRDKIIPGAFTDTLQDWADSGLSLPVIWSHRHEDPDLHIGYVEQAEERADTGLWVRGQLDIDDNPKAARVYRLLKGGRVANMSFAYDVLDGAEAEDDDGKAYYELRKLKLYEVGPTLIGANQQTSVLDVKHHDADGAKIGRTLSAKNETALRKAREAMSAAVTQIDDVLSAADADGVSDDGKTSATPAPPAPAENPQRVKTGVPARTGPASRRLDADLAALEAQVSSLTGREAHGPQETNQ